MYVDLVVKGHTKPLPACIRVLRLHLSVGQGITLQRSRRQPVIANAFCASQVTGSFKTKQVTVATHVVFDCFLFNFNRFFFFGMF